MKLMEDRIIKDAVIEDGEILKVGSFLNQQIDVPFITSCAQEIYRLFSGEGVTRILTIEASGIGLACLCAIPFGVPVVFAKKSRSSNIAGDVYTSRVFSFTHGTEHRILIPCQFLSSSDRVLLIDDFLASGEALRGLNDLCRQAGATVIGAGVFVEKVYQGGGNRLREAGMRIESLARIAAMSPESGITFE
jgi:xanthine phosphoribosyltransferase